MQETGSAVGRHPPTTLGPAMCLCQCSMALPTHPNGTFANRWSLVEPLAGGSFNIHAKAGSAVGSHPPATALRSRHGWWQPWPPTPMSLLCYLWVALAGGTCSSRWHFKSTISAVGCHPVAATVGSRHCRHRPKLSLLAFHWFPLAVIQYDHSYQSLTKDRKTERQIHAGKYKQKATPAALCLVFVNWFSLAVKQYNHPVIIVAVLQKTSNLVIVTRNYISFFPCLLCQMLYLCI